MQASSSVSQEPPAPALPSVAETAASRPPGHAPVEIRMPGLVVDYRRADPQAMERALAIEAPVNLVYGSVPYAVMMTTPADLVDFAYGFSLTEGIVARADEIRGAGVTPAEGGLHLNVDLVPGRLREHLSRKRAMSGRTGCGVCGVEDLAALPLARPRSTKGPDVAVAAIRIALDALEGQQHLGRSTRAVHAAAWAHRDGALLAVREDVGRHNALDKLIGALMRSGVDPDSGFVLITSRCSFEMAEKAAAFGASVVVAISAPTSLAVERARLHDMTLCAIARADTLTVFAGSERLILPDAGS